MSQSKKVACGLALAVGVAMSAPVVVAQRPQVSFPVIVVFDDNAPLDAFAGSYRPDDRAAANPQAWGYLDRGVAGATQNLERRLGFRAEHVFSHTVRGFSARLTARQVDELENNSMVDYIELDGVMTADVQTLPWGIDKIDADQSSTVAGNGSGTVSGVRVYIIDTGIDTQHTDLTVGGHVNFAGGPNTDCNGHGTHVAGTAAAEDNSSDVVGVAPGAVLFGVKVLGCSGSGSTSGVVKGIDWVTSNRVLSAVANMSLGGGVSQTLDNAVVRSVNAGVFYAIAAGNSGANACNSSPARAGSLHLGIVTTAATDGSDREASWSNYGSCVDIHAPGVSILSTRKGGGTTTLSGTSMASPHVAGAAALYLWSANGGNGNPGTSPASVGQALQNAAQVPGTVSKGGGLIKRLWVDPF